MAIELTTLPDFIITLDRAQHLVVERVDEIGNTVQAIDFGISMRANLPVGVWMEQDPDTRDALAPAINAYLLEVFAAQQ